MDDMKEITDRLDRLRETAEAERLKSLRLRVLEMLAPHAPSVDALLFRARRVLAFLDSYTPAEVPISATPAVAGALTDVIIADDPSKLNCSETQRAAQNVWWEPLSQRDDMIVEAPPAPPAAVTDAAQAERPRRRVRNPTLRGGHWSDEDVRAGRAMLDNPKVSIFVVAAKLGRSPWAIYTATVKGRFGHDDNDRAAILRRWNAERSGAGLGLADWLLQKGSSK